MQPSFDEYRYTLESTKPHLLMPTHLFVEFGKAQPTQLRKLRCGLMFSKFMAD